MAKLLFPPRHLSLKLPGTEYLPQEIGPRMAAVSLLPGVAFRFPPQERNDPLPAGGSLVLITDHIDAPADFLLIRAATTVLKPSKTQNPTAIKRCIFITLTKEESHWRAILGKSNTTGGPSGKDNGLVFIDLLSRWRTSKLQSKREETIFGDDHLDDAYKMLKAELINAIPGDTIVLIDDIAHLEWIGIEEKDVILFLRSLRSLLRAAGVSLLVVYHRLAIETPSSGVHRYLLSTCTAHIECRPLVSGRSGSVSGELHVHHGPEAWTGEVIVPNRRILHYRCTDTTALLFEKGSTSALP